MKLRTLAADPLLLKELASQTRRATRPGWTYPGPVWFLVVTLVPAVVFLKAWWMDKPDQVAYCFRAAALMHLWLLALRSALYTSTSLADDVQRGTIPVLLSTPLSPARFLTSKLVACTLPLWGEILAALPLSLGLYSGLGNVPPTTVLATAAFLWACTVLFGGLGLWLGSFLADPERAAGTARLGVGVLILATLIPSPAQDADGGALGFSSPALMLIAGFLLWLFLVWLPQVRPAHAVPGSIAALLLLLFLPITLKLAEIQSIPDLAGLSPIMAVKDSPPGSLLSIGAGYVAVGAVLVYLTLCRARTHLALRSTRHEP